MDSPHLSTTGMTREQAHQLWEAQLIDYQEIFRLAEEEIKILTAKNFEALYHTQAQRARLAQRIHGRDNILQAEGRVVQAPFPEILEDITVTIQAIIRIDNANRQHLEAEYAATSSSLQNLRQGRTALRQYKPNRERLPQFLNRTV